MHFIDHRNYLPGSERIAEREVPTVHRLLLRRMLRGRIPHLASGGLWGSETLRNLQGRQTAPA